MAAITHAGQVRIESFGAEIHPDVQEFVIRLVLANHERGIICKRPVGVMHAGCWRKWLTESSFRPLSMEVDPTFARASVEESIPQHCRLFWHRGPSICARSQLTAGIAG